MGREELFEGGEVVHLVKFDRWSNRVSLIDAKAIKNAMKMNDIMINFLKFGSFATFFILKNMIQEMRYDFFFC